MATKEDTMHRISNATCMSMKTTTMPLRKARQEFVARGLASAARARKSGRYVTAGKVLGKLARKLAKAKRRAA